MCVLLHCSIGRLEALSHQCSRNKLSEFPEKCVLCLSGVWKFRWNRCTAVDCLRLHKAHTLIQLSVIAVSLASTFVCYSSSMKNKSLRRFVCASGNGFSISMWEYSFVLFRCFRGDFQSWLRVELRRRREQTTPKYLVIRRGKLK